MAEGRQELLPEEPLPEPRALVLLRETDSTDAVVDVLERCLEEAAEALAAGCDDGEFTGMMGETGRLVQALDARLSELERSDLVGVRRVLRAVERCASARPWWSAAAARLVDASQARIEARHGARLSLADLLV